MSRPTNAGRPSFYIYYRKAHPFRKSYDEDIELAACTMDRIDSEVLPTLFQDYLTLTRFLVTQYTSSFKLKTCHFGESHTAVVALDVVCCI